MNDEMTPEQEGARLKELLGSRNKAQFAKDAKIPGGPSMLSQHLSGHRPISLGAATAYALGLGVRVEDFSPRLAKAIADASQTTAVIALAPLATSSSPPTLAQALEVVAEALLSADSPTRDLTASMLGNLARNPENHARVAIGLMAILGNGGPRQETRADTVAQGHEK